MADKNANGSLDLLRTFLAVHRTGSFTAAAQLVRLSQPTVTTQIRALEEQLGRQLFERLPRGVAPTAVADALAAEVAGPLDALDGVLGRDAGVPAPQPPVHLAGPADALATLVMPALAPLTAQGVRLRVSVGLAEELLEGLRAGRFDLVLSSIRPRGRALLAEPVMDEEFVLVAAPSWAALGGDQAVLRAAPLVSFAEDLPILRRYWRHVFGVRLTEPPAVVIPDLRGVMAAVVAGVGITVLPRYLCAAELASGALVALLEPDDPPINTAFVVQRAGTRPLPHVTLVRDRLVELAKAW
ncbi:LysR family transcriptional regulator [Nonomuraea sediminis]|uniref:LysR family transcriptional regulator n=1 Tax=Nonomuraea sediminis TaxID=2835864 RepID=UPI001BDCCC7A|nr:LysR family transcriptional regulator [Nonomuraea sediminis]